MAVYIASDRELPLVPWNDGAPSFHVDDIDESDATVRTQITEPHVCYAGSHEGCGCGFQLGEYPDFEDDERELKRASLDQLAEYLERAIASGARIRLFACWEGDQAMPIEHRRVLTPSDLRGDDFFFLERELSVLQIARA
jgi:hypothetical protein